jgi:trimeric autotransporter adhesin
MPSVRHILTFVLCLGVPVAIKAQTGKVVFNGQAVPGVLVTAVQGSQSFTTTTDDGGSYQLNGLAAGEWKLRVEMFGFQPQEKVVPAGSSETVVWTLNLREQKRQSQRQRGNDASAEVERQMTDALTATNSLAAMANKSDDVNESFLISGSVSQGLQAGDAPAGDWSAKKGSRNAGVNGVRGSFSWNLSDSLFDARPYSISGQRLDKPDYSQNVFALALSGPLPKVRLGRRPTFTLSYSHSRGRNPYTAFTTLPSQLERIGDFSDSITRDQVIIYDPTNRSPFPGNRIPRNRVAAASDGLLAFIPGANLPGNVLNYQFVSQVPQYGHNGRGVLDFRLSGKDRMRVQVQARNRQADELQLFGYRDQLETSTLSAGVSWTRTISARSVLSTWIYDNHANNDVNPFFANRDNVAAKLGIRGTSQDPSNYGPPTLQFTNFGELRDDSPAQRRDRTWYAGGGFYHSRDKHYLTFGMDFTRTRIENLTDENGRGTFFFGGLATSAFDSNGFPLAGTGFDFADFLLGLPQLASVRFGASNNTFRSTSYSTYYRHDWRALENFSVYFGVRYEYYGPFSEKNGRIVNLDIASHFAAVAPVTPGNTGPYSGHFPSSLIDSDRNNIAPRIGFSWRPAKKGSLKIAGGYGVYYNGSVYSRAAFRLASQPPFANTGTLNTSLDSPLRIETGLADAASSPNDQIRNTYAVDRRYRIGYAQIWNFAVSRTLPHALAVDVGYLGTKGTRLDIQRLPNRAAPGSPLTSEQRRVIANAVAFAFDSSDGNSILHAAQFRLTRRFQKGMSVNALYTYSKSIDNASSFGGGVSVVAQNDLNLRAERGLSSFDQRHVLKLNYLVLSPLGDEGAPIRVKGPVGLLFRNWAFNGGIQAQSGGWLTARVLGNRSDTGGTGAIGSGRADATGLGIGTGFGFFNPAAFAIPATSEFGNAGRNTIPVPAMFNLNLSVSRRFPIDERRSLEATATSENFGNFVNITGFGTTVNASNYGVASSAGKMRTVSISLRLRF